MSNYIYNDNFGSKGPEHFNVYYKTTEKRRTPISLYICTALIVFAGLCVLGGGIFNYMAQNQTHKITYIAQSDVDQTIDASPLVTGGGEQASLVEVIASVKDSVVEISSIAGNGRGSGVIVGKFDGSQSNDGYYVITNAHVIQGDLRNTYIPTVATLTDGTKYKTEFLALDEKNDIAVLKIYESKRELTCAAWAEPGTELFLGEEVIAIGNPMGVFGGTVTIGHLSALHREMVVNGHKMSLIQTDAAVNPGNSGGALFNRHGALIGIVNAKIADEKVEGLGFAIPYDVAFEAYNNMTEPQSGLSILTKFNYFRLNLSPYKVFAKGSSKARP